MRCCLWSLGDICKTDPQREVSVGDRISCQHCSNEMEVKEDGIHWEGRVSLERRLASHD